MESLKNIKCKKLLNTVLTVTTVPSWVGMYLKAKQYALSPIISFIFPKQYKLLINIIFNNFTKNYCKGTGHFFICFYSE